MRPMPSFEQAQQVADVVERADACSKDADRLSEAIMRAWDVRRHQ